MIFNFPRSKIRLTPPPFKKVYCHGWNQRLGKTSPSGGFFTSVSHDNAFMGGLCGKAEALPIPYSGIPTDTDLPSLILALSGRKSKRPRDSSFTPAMNNSSPSLRGYDCVRHHCRLAWSYIRCGERYQCPCNKWSIHGNQSANSSACLCSCGLRSYPSAGLLDAIESKQWKN